MNEETGDVIVKDVWLKKIWEITKPMDGWPIKLQVKNGIVHKIRPCNWYSSRGRGKIFENLKDYLAAFEETVYKDPQTHNQAGQWKNRFRRSYKNHYGKDINFPKWNDIESKYWQ